MNGQRLYQNELLILIFALLICNAARGLACRLTRGLALATTAGSNSLLDILGFDSLDSLHNYFLHLPRGKSYFYGCIISQGENIVNRFKLFFVFFN